MSQHPFTIPNGSGLQVRTDLVAALQALASLSAGPAAPATPYAYQPWLDIGASPWVLRLRNAANDAWIALLLVDDADDTVRATLKGLTMTGAILAAGGTAAAPGLAFSGDPDTGLYRVGANQLGLVAGAVRVALLQATGFSVEKILRLANLASAALPAASAGNLGALAFDTDLGQFVGNADGATWTPLGGAGPWQESFTGAVVALNVLMPLNSTDPTTAEGVEVASIPGVVVGAGQKVRIEVDVSAFCNDQPLVVALFRDASCLATRAVNGYAAPDSCYNNFFAVLDAPAAGTYTYAVRAGPHASTTNVRLNASTSTGSAGPASLKSGLRLRTE